MHIDEACNVCNQIIIFSLMFFICININFNNNKLLNNGFFKKKEKKKCQLNMFESIVGLEIMVFRRMKAGDIPKGSRVLLLSLIGSPNGVTMAWTKLKCLVLSVRRVILSKKISRDFTSVTILLIIEDLAAKWKKKYCFDLTMKY